MNVVLEMTLREAEELEQLLIDVLYQNLMLPKGKLDYDLGLLMDILQRLEAINA